MFTWFMVAGLICCVNGYIEERKNRIIQSIMCGCSVLCIIGIVVDAIYTIW